ncbi:MAG: DUF86 domain-containing protein [Oligoflexales bacterium]|nr:DUF86 domain-containing protein [Oligoflexales bacterium]
MTKDDVLINKMATIQRCIKRVKEEYDGFELEFRSHYTKQDSIVLNLQRLCETSIDLASYIVRKKKLGIPQSSRDVFSLLESAQIIDKDLCSHLQAMVGFRNIAIHEYRKLDLDIVESVIKNRLADFEKLAALLIVL